MVEEQTLATLVNKNTHTGQLQDLLHDFTKNMPNKALRTLSDEAAAKHQFRPAEMKYYEGFEYTLVQLCDGTNDRFGRTIQPTYGLYIHKNGTLLIVEDISSR